MKILEDQQAKGWLPIFNSQWDHAARAVASYEIRNIDYIVDSFHVRMKEYLLKEYKRVADKFSEMVFTSYEEGMKKGIQIKGMQDEFWRDMSNWMNSQGGMKIVGLNASTKRTIAKIIKSGMSQGLSNEQIAKTLRMLKLQTNKVKARRIARTETHTAAVKAVDTSVKSTRVKFEREWVSALDDRVRGAGLKDRYNHLIVDKRNGKKGQEEPFNVSGELLMFPGDPKGSAGNIINCIADSYKTPVFTSEGWKWIKNIKPGDMVLTHKNRFRRVKRTLTRLYTGELIKFSIKSTNGNCERRNITITPNHPFLVDGKWKVAKDIKQGNKVSMMASYCGWCGKPIPYWQKFCSITCSSKKTTERQWGDPKHRKLMSRKARVQIKREYANGTRDKNEIIKAGRKACFDKYGKGGFLGQAIKFPRYRERGKQAIVKKYGSVLEMLKQTAFPALGKVAKSGTSIEKAMGVFLTKKGREFIHQFKVGRRRIDFYVEEKKLFIECDGYPWHQDKEAERKRDLEILTQYPDHKIAHVTYKTNPPTWEFFDLLALNHKGTFGQLPLEISKVETFIPKVARRVYNMAVEEDESYVVKGFVTHNCRCVLLYHTTKPAVAEPGRTTPVGEPVVPEFVPAGDIAEAQTRLGKMNMGRWSQKGKERFSDKKFLDHVLNPLLKEVERLREEIPVLKKFMDKAANLSRNEIYKGETLPPSIGGVESAGVMADYAPSSGSIRMGYPTYKGGRGLSLGPRFHNVGSSVLDNFTHEYAHHISNVGWQAEGLDIYKYNVKFISLYKQKGSAWFKKKVSKYAATNSEEAWAESLSAWFHPKYGTKRLRGVIDGVEQFDKPLRLPKEIEDIFKKAFPKKVPK